MTAHLDPNEFAWILKDISRVSMIGQLDVISYMIYLVSSRLRGISNINNGS